MATKYQFITGVYESTINRVTDIPAAWTAFLRSACRNYKCRFDEQILIYAQRPNATAVLEIELLSITLDDIDFDKSSIHINKTIQRVGNDALSLLPHHSIINIFNSKLEKSKSSLIIKTPKTKTSCRTVYLTQPLIREIQESKACIEAAQSYFSWEGHNLLFCLEESGDPIEANLCEKWFKQWQEENLPVDSRISFHGIRHSSASCKLILSEGDYKAVQGDTGHKTADMISCRVTTKRQFHRVTVK